MPNYIEDRKTIEVPPAVGVSGYLKVVENILELGRVQEVTIKIGKVTFLRFRKEDEPEQELRLDLDTLMPSAVLRGLGDRLEELTPREGTAATAVAELFAKAHMDGFNPTAFVVGAASWFRGWHLRSTGVLLPKDEAYGLPLLADVQIPDEALILCAAYGKRAALIDSAKAYKITIPWRPQ